MLSLWPAFLGILFFVGFLTATEDKLRFFLITLILFVPTALAIIAFNKKKQKYDEAVKKTKDIENDPTLSWLQIRYRNSFAFSYISACSKLKSPAFITEYFIYIRKSLIRLLNSLMRDSSFQAKRKPRKRSVLICSPYGRHLK